MIRLGNNEVLKTLTKTLTFVDADTNADAGGSTIALPERCSGELKIVCGLSYNQPATKYFIYFCKEFLCEFFTFVSLQVWLFMLTTE